MFAFIIYAVAVWYFAARWRRKVLGFAVVLAGLTGLAIVAYLHILLNIKTQGRIYLPVMQVLLYPYAGLVGAVGVFVASLPRAPRTLQCGRCRYNLEGLPLEGLVCPECGAGFAVQTRRGCCGLCKADLTLLAEAERVCPGCGATFEPGAGHFLSRARRARPAQEGGPPPAGPPPAPSGAR